MTILPEAQDAIDARIAAERLNERRRMVARHEIEAACVYVIRKRWHPNFGHYDTPLPNWWWILPPITNSRTGQPMVRR